MRPQAILIAGPTASGKTAFAVSLAGALGGVVINADSMQVYEGLHILTARPTAAECAEAPHKLYGHIDAAELYTAARWLTDVKAEIAQAATDGLIPIITGGTGMYFTALTVGLADIPEIPDAVRMHVRDRLQQEGSEALHKVLADKDPETALRLAAGDSQRIARALEVLEATGKSITAFQKETKPGPLGKALGDGLVETAILSHPRSLLYARAETRFDQMMQMGAVEEVAELAARHLDPALPLMKALGVPSLMRYLDGSLDKDSAVADAKMQTRRFIKRQETWFRNQFWDWNSLNAQQMSEETKKIIIKLQKYC